MSHLKTKRSVRVCVLVRGQEWDELLPGRSCLSRIHGHMTSEVAEDLVDKGMAEWIMIEKHDRKGGLRTVRVAAIRLIPRRTWKGKISAGGDGRPMKVMQLVY